MAKYELGAVYKIETETEKVYYARLLEDNIYGVFAPLAGELCEATLSKTPYRLYFCCNSFPVKRGIWEKVLLSPNPKDIACWQRPEFLANFANFNREFFLERCGVYHKGLSSQCTKKQFVDLVKTGMISHIFNRHENIPGFLMDYYDGYPDSYILSKKWLKTGTQEYQTTQLKALEKLGFDTAGLLG